MPRPQIISYLFFFNDTATTEIYTLSLHDALPIFRREEGAKPVESTMGRILLDAVIPDNIPKITDRKSTRLNSSHQIISYAVFCLKKKKKTNITSTRN